MANTIWKEVFLIMCSGSRENARNTERFSLSLRITDDYALQTLCGEQHNVYNDEGKIMQMPLNRALRGEDGKIYDAIAGSFFICGLGEDDFCSLPKGLQAKYLEKFRWPEKFLTVGGNLVAVQDKPRESTHKQPTQER